MGWFYLSWIIVSAVYVSCQELTTSLPEGNDACTRNEVNFTCTIRGSPNLTTLILSWSSLEYIGRDDPPRFTSENMPGTNFSSVINENVTAILTSNTMMDGVPVLVSELRIVTANQNSVITCNSVTNRSSTSTNFIVPVFPNSPQNVMARQVSQDCDLSLTWNHPANTDIDGLTYKIYVPSRDIVIPDVSDTNHEFNVVNCRDDDVHVLVAAVNRFGCEGPDSFQIQPILLEMSTPQLSPGAIAGIVVAVAMMAVAVAVAMVVVMVVVAVKVNERKQVLEQTIAMKEETIAMKEELITEMEQTIAEQKKQIQDQNSKLRELQQKNNHLENERRVLLEQKRGPEELINR